MTFWPPMGPFKYPHVPKKALLGVFGPQRALEFHGSVFGSVRSSLKHKNSQIWLGRVKIGEQI